MTKKDASFRKKILPILGFLSGLIALAAAFLPFAVITLGNYSQRFDAIQMIYYNIRYGSILVEIPLGMRICILLSLVFTLLGLVLIVMRKYLHASAFLFGAAVSSIVQLIFISQIAQEASRAGITPATASMLGGWTSFLLLSLLAAALSLAVNGLEKSAEMVFKVCATISIGMVIVITVYMFISGSPAIVQIGPGAFLFGTKWLPTASSPQFGILYMILASLIGCIGAIAIGVPIGLMTAVFLAEIAPKWVRSIVRPSVELLAGIPSVIYGFWGMKVLVPFIRTVFTKLGFSTTGSGLMAVILILAVMILPTIVSVAESALKSVPVSYTEAALALGNTKISTIFSVQIPAARSGILAGVILGVGRAIGETMAVIMVAGNIVQFPTLLSSVRPMTAGIAFEMGYAEAGLHRQALFAIGLVLFVFIMLVNITFTFISRRGVQMDAK